MVKLIVAMTANKLIGKGDKLPWNLPIEAKHFYQTTLNHALLFGQNTFLNLPKKLHKRKIYVLSKNKVKNADQTIHNEQELMQLFKKYQNSSKILFIAGGKMIYEKYAEYADEWIISYIWGNYVGDVYLNISPKNYLKFSVKNYSNFDVVVYKKTIL